MIFICTEIVIIADSIEVCVCRLLARKEGM